MENVNETIQAAQEKFKELAENLKGEMVGTETFEATKTELADARKELKDLAEIVEKQGKLISTENSVANQKNGVKSFVEKYTKAIDDRRSDQEPVSFQVTDKAWDSSDTIAVGDADTTAYPANGVAGLIEHTDGNTPANSFNWKPYFSQFVGWIAKPKPKTNILNLIDIIPLVSDRLYAFVDGVVGTVEVVPECELKPIVTPSLDVVSADAKTVAVFWKISNKFIKYYGMIVNRFIQKLGELINDAIPNLVLAEISSNASSFSLPSGFALVNAPNNYDALVAVGASLEMLGYTPSGILISPIDYANMKLTKGWDTNYSLSNNGSIALVNGNLEYNGEAIPYIKDPTLAAGTFVMGDFSVVKAGMDAGLTFRQGTNDNDDLRRNLTANVLEKDFVVLVTDSAAIIKDTFANVKTLINDPEGTCIPICPEGETD